jgi:antitoxin VapB
MPLVIDDPGAEQLARELADLCRQDIAVAVIKALRREVERRRYYAQPLEDRAAVLRALDEIAERVSRLPVLDHRSADEILGYNEHGHFD